MENIPATSTPSLSTLRHDRIAYVRGFTILGAVTLIGLYIAKWNPYYHKTFVAAAKHSLGASIISGKSAVAPTPSLGAALSYAVTYFNAIWIALVVGLLMSATIETLIPREWIARVLGSPSVRSSALGGLLALPGMMCTCCTAPVIVGMRKSGVSEGAAVTFFLGNPTLNPAVLVFLVFTLGWKWAVLRLVLGVALVVGAAALAMRLTRGTSSAAVVLPEARMPVPDQRHWLIRWFLALGRLVVSLIPEYVVIVLLLGAARAWLFPASAILHGTTLLVVIGLAIAATFFVIPTAGEIPIIQTLLAFGLSTSAAGVLLLTLAPISAPSLAMVWRVFPKRVLISIVGLTIVAGILAGGIAFALHL